MADLRLKEKLLKDIALLFRVEIESALDLGH